MSSSVSGTCVSRIISQTAIPSLHRHYPASQLLRIARTSTHRSLPPRGLGWSEGAFLHEGRPWISPVTNLFLISDSKCALTPGWPRHLAVAVPSLLPARTTKRSADPDGIIFRGSFRFKVGVIRYLYSSSGFLPTHQPTHYCMNCKAGYGARS